MTYQHINVTSPSFKANPFPFYTWLRNEAPVYRITLPDKRPAWLIARYDDVLNAVKDERLVKDRHNILNSAQKAAEPWRPAFVKPIEHNMLMRDGADHARLRSLVHKGFTPRRIEAMRVRIQQISDELIDAMLRKNQIDLIRDFALPLPVTVISDILGVPQADRHKFHQWSQAMIASSASNGLGQLRAIPNIWMFVNYIRKFLQLRRADPQDDLTTALVQAELEGDKLSEDELVAMVFLLLVAGHETTVNLIGNGILALFEHPDQRERLHANPSLGQSAIEELLRYTSPVEMADERFAREDITLHGITIPKGEMVYGVILSANRDERQFPNPDTLDIGRTPNRHLAFSQGVHYCLGAPLARMEGQIAITTLLARMPDLQLTLPASSLRWNSGIMLRGLAALPVRNGRIRAAA